MTEWLNDWVTEWLNDQITGWQDDQVTKWLSDQVTEWPSDQVTEWLSDRVMEWPSDRVTEWLNDRVTEWPNYWVTGWQEASQTIDRMVYFNKKTKQIYKPSVFFHVESGPWVSTPNSSLEAWIVATEEVHIVQAIGVENRRLKWILTGQIWLKFVEIGRN